MKTRDYESAFILGNLKDKNPFLNDIFTQMSVDVKNNSRVLNLEVNDSICRKGDETNYVFIVLKGELVVINEFESGKIFEPVTIQHSDFIGVVEAMLQYDDYISTVSATEDVEYIRIPKDIFLTWIQNNTRISNLVLESVCKNFSQNMQESGEQVLLDSMYLFIGRILKHAKKEGNLFVLSETREKTAIRTGINLRTLYRYIKKLKQMNYIVTHQRKIAFTNDQKEKLFIYNQALRNK